MSVYKRLSIACDICIHAIIFRIFVFRLLSPEGAAVYRLYAVVVSNKNILTVVKNINGILIFETNKFWTIGGVYSDVVFYKKDYLQPFGNNFPLVNYKNTYHMVLFRD